MAAKAPSGAAFRVVNFSDFVLTQEVLRIDLSRSDVLTYFSLFWVVRLNRSLGSPAAYRGGVK